jgi:hypothetical protein
VNTCDWTDARVGWFDGTHEHYGVVVADDNDQVRVVFDDGSDGWFPPTQLFLL